MCEHSYGIKEITEWIGLVHQPAVTDARYSHLSLCQTDMRYEYHIAPSLLSISAPLICTLLFFSFSVSGQKQHTLIQTHTVIL